MSYRGAAYYMARAAAAAALLLAPSVAPPDTSPVELRAAVSKLNQQAPNEVTPAVPATERSRAAKSLKQLFRRAAPKSARFTWPGKPTTVAREQRKALKRRNRQRHKAHLRRRSRHV